MQVASLLASRTPVVTEGRQIPEEIVAKARAQLSGKVLDLIAPWKATLPSELSAGCKSAKLASGGGQDYAIVMASVDSPRFWLSRCTPISDGTRCVQVEYAGPISLLPLPSSI